MNYHYLIIKELFNNYDDIIYPDNFKSGSIKLGKKINRLARK